MGLRGRLIWIVTLGLGLSLVASLGVLMRIEQRIQSKDAADRAGAMLASLSAPVSLLLADRRLDDVDRVMQEIEARRSTLDLREILVVGEDGRVLAATGKDEKGKDVAAGDPFIAAAVASAHATVDPPPPDRPARVAVPVQIGGKRATMIGALSDDVLRARLADRRMRLIVSAVAVSLLGLTVLLALLSWEVLRPLRRIVDVARKMAAGDLRARAPLQGGAELMMLAHTLNDAARRLGAQREELESAVVARTAALERANKDLHVMNDRLEKLAITDPLTGLFNRRYLEQALSFEVTRQKRTNRPFSVVMIDVDEFKRFNDTHGHPAGDEVLKQLAAILRENVRASDTLARYGGEEFVILLIDVEGDAAMKAAEKVRAAVASHTFPRGDTQRLGFVSISLGVACWPRHGTSGEDVVQAADIALYESKSRGRNRVTLAAGRGIAA